jgi:uncharacterized protein YjgD (DUF1641 family)
MTSSMDSTMAGTTSAEMDRVLTAARDALTDSMVERLASTSADVIEVVDRLSDPDTREAVHAIIDKVTEIHRIGALDTLFQTIMVIHAARSATTDSIVERLAAFVEQSINTLGSDELAQCCTDLVQALETATVESKNNPPKGGMLATLSLLGKPELQQSLYFLLKMGESFSRTRCGR